MQLELTDQERELAIDGLAGGIHRQQRLAEFFQEAGELTAAALCIGKARQYGELIAKLGGEDPCADW